MIPRLRAGIAIAGMGDVSTRSATIRVGLVPYLNVRPLVWAFEQPQFRDELEASRFTFGASAPRLLARRLRSGEFDVAIVPVMEYYLHDGYTVVPGSCISTLRDVGSVMLYSESPLETLQTIQLDTSSLTSANLVRVVMAERRQAVTFADYPGAADAPVPQRCGRLLIGDPALRERGRHAHEYDLGGLWNALTGLPFVFAAWLVSPCANCARVNEALRRAREIGEENIERISAEAAGASGFSRAFVAAYYRENLALRLDAEQVAGWREFGRLCVSHGLCRAATEVRWHRL
jgi:chorismate dehydratase